MLARGLKWADAEEIALRLLEARPHVHPLQVRFTDLHAWVLALEDFHDAPGASNEAVLEAIQMAWLEDYEDSQENSL
jgi:FeS assembly protein IscX